MNIGSISSSYRRLNDMV